MGKLIHNVERWVNTYDVCVKVIFEDDTSVLIEVDKVTTFDEDGEIVDVRNE